MGPLEWCQLIHRTCTPSSGIWHHGLARNLFMSDLWKFMEPRWSILHLKGLHIPRIWGRCWVHGELLFCYGIQSFRRPFSKPVDGTALTIGISVALCSPNRWWESLGVWKMKVEKCRNMPLGLTRFESVFWNHGRTDVSRYYYPWLSFLSVVFHPFQLGPPKYEHRIISFRNHNLRLMHNFV